MKATASAVERWDRMFRILQIYFRNHGHVDVAPETRADSLYQWLEQQRARHRLGRLPAQQVRQLDALGIFPEPNSSRRAKRGGLNQERWDKHFAQLVAFKKRFGHCDVPCDWKEDRFFGRWVSHQREFRKKGSLSEERISRLTKLGFKWAIRDGPHGEVKSRSAWITGWDQQWERKFAVLLAYKKKHGHCCVPQHEPGKDSLGKWIATQRRLANKNELRSDRQERLDRIGFVWDGMDIYEDHWNERFAQLAAFKKQFDHCDVPVHWGRNHALGSWVSWQRRFRRRGQLSKERVERLTKLGFRWEAVFNPTDVPGSYRDLVAASDKHWDRMFAALLKYQKTHGHCQVIKQAKGQEALGRWVARQRLHARRKQLRPDRRAQLDRIGFVWSGNFLNEKLWDERFSQLAAFKQRFGQCNVPQQWAGNPPLGSWVSNQRAFRRRRKLSQNRIDRLDKLGFTWAILEGRSGRIIKRSAWQTPA